jgi:hypothetical protein
VFLLLSPIAARADVVRAPGVQFADLKPYGAYTVVFSERSFDTTGAAVPPLTRYTVRFPVGMSIRGQFLKKRFLCAGEKLRQLRERKDPGACRNARLGGGKAEAEVLDANDMRLLNVPVPARIHFFLGKATQPGAVASMVILAVPDASAPIVKANPGIRAARLLGEAHFFDDPTPDGLFGYRLELPVALGGLRYNAARGDFRFPGLTLRKRVRECVRSGRGGGTAKCRKRRARVKRIFWAKPPKCPASGKLTFQADYRYRALPPMTITRQIPCPPFERSSRS